MLRNSLDRKWFKVLGGLYLVLLTYLLFLAFFRKGTITDVNFIPFKSIIEFSEYFNLNENFHWEHILYWTVNVPGNVIAFIPIPLIIYSWQKKTPSIRTKLLVSLLTPTLIESTQLIFQVGSCNIDDVILNFIGFILGYMLLSRILRNKAKAN